MPIVSEEFYDECMRTDDMDALLAKYRELGWFIAIYAEEDITELAEDEQGDYIYTEDGDFVKNEYHVKYIYDVRNERCACGGNLLFHQRGGHNFEHCIQCRKTNGPISDERYKRILSKVEKI